jgi:hypothetical protein
MASCVSLASDESLIQMLLTRSLKAKKVRAETVFVRLVLLSTIFLCSVANCIFFAILGSHVKSKLFLLEIDRVMAELLGLHSFPWSDFEIPGLIAGAVGAVMSWVTGGIFFYICNFLLALSGMYFLVMIPYFMFSQQRQAVPLVALVCGMNVFATGLRVGFLMEAPYDTKAFCDLFYWFLGTLIAYCVFANVVVYAQSSNAPATIEKSDNVEQLCLVKTEPLLEIQIV